MSALSKVKSVASRLLAPTRLSIWEGSAILVMPDHLESHRTRLVIWCPVKHRHETHIPASLLALPEEPGQKEVVLKAEVTTTTSSRILSLQTL